MAVTEYMVKITTFDIIPVHLIEDYMYYFPNGDPYNLNFEQSGIESKLFLENIGFILWIIIAHVFLLLIHLCIFKLNGKCNYATKANKKLSDYLYYNGLTRLFMEVFLDIAIMATLNMKTVDWNTKFNSIKASNIISVSLLTLFIFLQLYIVIFYCCKTKQFVDRKFQVKHTEILSGTKVHL